jgi:hypothetical protein
MGRAISKAITVAEIIKRRVANLHQLTHISSMEVENVFEPIVDGLEKYTPPHPVPLTPTGRL